MEDENKNEINKEISDINKNFDDNKKEEVDDNKKEIIISKEILENYIEHNINNIDNLISLKKNINKFGKIEKIEKYSKDINEIIHDLILKSDKNIRFKYFIEDEIYFNPKYDKLRKIDILNDFDLAQLIELNNSLKNSFNLYLEKIFSSRKNEFYNLIISRINNINDIKKVYDLIEENQILINKIGQSFDEKINDDNLNISIDISDLIVFCVENKFKLEKKLIHILKKNKNEKLFKEVLIQLINSGDNNDLIIKKCFNYLENEPLLFLEIINLKKDKYYNKFLK